MRLHLSLFVFFVLKLVFTAAQAGGSVSHGDERIWLNTVYEVAWILDGKDQQYILPFLSDAKDRGAKNYDGYRGTGPDQKLEFKEFMDCIAGKWKGTCTIDLTDDLDDVAEKLNKGGFGNALKVVQARGWKNSALTQKADPTIYHYDRFLKDMSIMVNKCRSEKGDSAIQGQLDRLRTLADKIVQIRDADFRQQKSVANDLEEVFLQRTKKDPVSGKDVKDEDASGRVIYEQTTEGGTKVDDRTRPDFVKTMADAKNKKLFKEKLGNSKKWRTELNNWIDRYADNAWINEANSKGGKIPTYPARAQGHYRVLEAWKSISEMHGRCAS
ncbi:hypothetical protein Daus18300_010701 [Diaporthe australafricana]|uniref:Uncharacterized protein n=1 Tax=Diaporthe australafricana TaxID=127596 RepID=A0ABR3W949_9PEZI